MQNARAGVPERASATLAAETPETRELRRLKAECLPQRPPTRAAAQLKIFDYIEGFYNRHRLHSSLNYQSPLAFERSFGYSNN